MAKIPRYQERAKGDFDFSGISGVYNPYVTKSYVTNPIAKTHQAGLDVLLPFGVNTRPAPFSPKLNSAEEVIMEIEKIQKEDRAGPFVLSEKGYKEVEQVWGRLSKELRSNPEEMLKLASKHPASLSLANPTIFSQDVALKALEISPRAYDLLSPQMQQDEAIINKYVASMLNNATPMTVELKHQSLIKPWPDEKDIHISILPINENCPTEKLFSDKNIRQAWEMMFNMQGVHSASASTGLKYGIGPSQAFIALAYEAASPERKAEIHALAVDTFNANKENIVQALSSYFPNKEFESHIKGFMDHHKLGLDIAQLKDEVFTTMCEKAANAIEQGKSKKECDLLVLSAMLHVSPEKYKQYFDAEKYWTQRGKESAQTFIANQNGYISIEARPKHYEIYSTEAREIFTKAFNEAVDAHNKEFEQKLAFDRNDSVGSSARNAGPTLDRESKTIESQEYMDIGNNR